MIKKKSLFIVHAGIGLNTVKNLARKLRVTYIDATIEELAQTIDNINAQFQEHAQNNTISKFYEQEKKKNHSKSDDEAPLKFIMRNRKYDGIERPMVHFNYHVNFVHGHHFDDPTKDNIYNLENTLGKSESENKGIYTVLYSPNEINIAHQKNEQPIHTFGFFNPESVSKNNQSEFIFHL